jgi:PAS domain S-box-containing protein
VYDTKLSEDFIRDWKSWYDKALEGEEFSVIKKVSLFKKKSHLEITFKPIVEEGEVIAIACYAQDITKHKEEEIKMGELVKRLNLAQKIGKLGYWEFDLTTEDIFWSDEVYKIWGIDKGKFHPNFELFLNTIHPDDRDSFLTQHQNTLKGIGVLDAVHRIVLPDGKIKHVHEKGELETDPRTGNVTFRGTVQDISLDKEKELLLHQKTRLISATSIITASLLESEDWQKILINSIQLMGETVETERGFLISLAKDQQDQVTANLTHQWIYGQGTEELHEAKFQAIPLALHPEFIQGLEKRKPFFFLTKDTTGATNQLLTELQIKSLLMVPVFLGDEAILCIGFDDCKMDRVWTDDELNFMHALSTNLALAMERIRNLEITNEAFESRNSLLESIGESFYALDKNYRVTYWNNGIEKLTQIKREEILGKSIWEFISIVNNEFKTAYTKAFEENKTQYFETFDHWVKAWLEVTVYPANGGISVIIKDITARKNTEKRLEESLDRFAIITEATNDAIWDWNIVTDEHFWGEGFHKLFGIELGKDGITPESWDHRVHPDDFTSVYSKMEEILGDPEVNYFETEYRFQRNDGSYSYVNDKGSIIRDKDGTALRVVGAIQDITHRKAFEESLKILNSELANSNRELEISNKELEQFAYVASHDLQEPLRMITSFLGLIERKYKDSLDEKGLQYIHFAVNGAKRMRKIILDLLEFSTLGNLSDSKKETDMNGLVQEVIELNKKTIEEKQAIIHLDKLPETVCHTSSMIQVFQNLISNGLKYQPEGQIPEIWISGKELTKAWQFEVRDNGIGIEPEFREKVFVIFQRLHQKEQYSGSGIGLAICKKIVEFHGGRIWIESTPGQGCTFLFTIQK